MLKQKTFFRFSPYDHCTAERYNLCTMWWSLNYTHTVSPPQKKTSVPPTDDDNFVKPNGFQNSATNSVIFNPTRFQQCHMCRIYKVKFECLPYHLHACTGQSDIAQGILRRRGRIYLAACNATHGIAVAILSVCPSVRPSDACIVTKMTTKQRTADILIPHETAITLVFWHQHWLVGDVPFSVKYSPKVTHPLSKNAEFDRFSLITSQP